MTNEQITRRADPLEVTARELATAAGLNPDARVPHDIKEGRTMPAWCTFRSAARTAQDAAKLKELQKQRVNLKPQDQAYQNAPLDIFGVHEQNTLDQMRHCMSYGNVVKGVLCADGHFGYAQPVGGVIAYEGQVSISGVGFDIACGNMAVRLDTPYAEVKDRIGTIIQDVVNVISFGVGRYNDTRVEHEMFDLKDLWDAADIEDMRRKAAHQLGTVGAGNHYVDIFYDDDGLTWIGVHFGSRGLGHTAATRYMKAAGGKDGMMVAPALVDIQSELGQRYLAAMELGGKYAYAGREWVVEQVRRLIGGQVTKSVHNHHNYAWVEKHDGRDLFVVRKGATPAFPGQLGFIGGSMGDDAVIIEGVDSEKSRQSLYSTVHGAGRMFGRNEAKRRFTKDQMDGWLLRKGVIRVGGDLDESPMAYRRLDEVLAHHDETIRVLYTLHPVAVAMAGDGIVDPYRD